MKKLILLFLVLLCSCSVEQKPQSEAILPPQEETMTDKSKEILDNLIDKLETEQAVSADYALNLTFNANLMSKPVELSLESKGLGAITNTSNHLKSSVTASSNLLENVINLEDDIYIFSNELGIVKYHVSDQVYISRDEFDTNKNHLFIGDIIEILKNPVSYEYLEEESRLMLIIDAKPLIKHLKLPNIDPINKIPADSIADYISKIDGTCPAEINYKDGEIDSINIDLTIPLNQVADIFVSSSAGLASIQQLNSVLNLTNIKISSEVEILPPGEN